MSREGGDPPPPSVVSGETAGGCTKVTGAEWQFVNFNPAIYGRGGALAQAAKTTPPPVPPREPSAMMPPPRPPPLLPSPPPVPATEPLQNAAGMVSMRGGVKPGLLR
jgi:hypothetical protein